MNRRDGYYFGSRIGANEAKHEESTMSRSHWLELSSLGCLLIFHGTGRAQDWPQWRGPNRDARVQGFQAPASWPKALKQQWKVTIGDGVATPALVGNKLYVITRQDGNEVIRCVEAETGKELWQEKYASEGATGAAAGFSGPRASPTVADGKVITLGIRGTLTCLDAATGKIHWQKNDFPGAWPRFFTSASPLVIDGSCIVEVGGRDNGGIVAYDLADGKERWKWSGDGPAYASPVVMKVGDVKLVVTQTDSKMVALRADNGKLVWETPFATQGRAYNAATPIIDGQTIIYGGGGRGTIAVKLEKEGDSLVGKQLWSNTDQSVQFNTPVLRDGRLYGIAQDGSFFCLDATNGKTLWKAAPKSAEAGSERGGRGGRGGSGYGSIVDTGSVLLALTPSAELMVIEPNESAYVEKARIKVAEWPTYAYPVPAGKRLLVKDRDSLALLTWE